ncbi:MAG: Two-component system histidine kinase DccS [uncultured Sulfurovum sp.]|uniref:histidine kinase n=1 Tax=uncultured Sulfurovum sp. TaxID=269237 RepID=A0A6S6TGW4_9BACT|nr:MAG: Two-component system histidine kinase DccS [uncultured Sulfurovum sp.]
MLKSEKKSLIRFLLIYLGSTMLLFSLASWIFYTSQKHHILDQQRDELKVHAEQLEQELRALHKSVSSKLFYPRDATVDSSIYDKNREYIFGSVSKKKLLSQQVYMNDENKLYYFTKIEPYYLGAAFLLVEKNLNKKPIYELQKNILLFLMGVGVIFTFLGLFLGKLFVAPMRESMEQMNHFIQDTTHELNTPISTILTNIEMLETFGKCEKSDELQRIEIASKTLSRIYDDLTYLNLNHNYHREIEDINLSKFLKERMLYFSMMAETKSLKIEVDIKDNVILKIDKNDLTRLIDNLISNAIKYNKLKGLLTVRLSSDSLTVEDTGVGIDKKDLNHIFQRFKRANKSEGGFGIGLDIVNQVVNSYEYSLYIDSERHKGTKVSIEWKK